MEKRVMIAAALSMLVLLAWSALSTKLQPIENKRVTQQIAQPQTLAPVLKPIAAPVVNQTGQPAPALINLKYKKAEITFDEPKAAIKEVVFQDYQSHKFLLQDGFLLGDRALNFKKVSTELGKPLVFVSHGENKEIIKRFTIDNNSNYYIELEIIVRNLSAQAMDINLPLYLGRFNSGAKPAEARYQDIMVSAADKVLRPNWHKDTQLSGVKFLAFRDRYFSVILQPVSADSWTGFIKKVSPQESEMGVNLSLEKIAPGQRVERKFRIYLGPQELRIINSINPEWAAVMYYGTFDFIAHLLLQLLDFLYRLTHSWGWTIVVLSFLIYLLLYPLTLKQMRSMKAMQSLQPKVEALRVLYKDNPQKLNKEIMELYRQNKVNPFGGCLPLILQIPVFFALYQVLMRSIALKGAKFLWIKDLSEPDRLITLPVTIPYLGNEINILPILMAIGMFVQQKITTVATGSNAEQQKLMAIIFPLMFGVLFYHMPSGLVLYWFINSTLMLAYQLKMSRVK